ncbi:MAG: hypothetical protein JNL70_00495 [Saprospiraceae bacterium]|nr:hypothetical protein [Saprospiraceae bacterium]
MNLLEGIQLHELILMILGFILGLVLIFVFLFSAMKGRTNLKLLYGFAAPLVMIGYPSIQSVEFSKDVVKIDKLVQQVNQNPSDTAAQRILIEEIGTLPKSRCVNSTEALTTIADAQAALGLYDSAKVTIQKAITRDPNSVKAKESQKDIQKKWGIQKNFEQKVEDIKHNMNQLEQRPNDIKLRDSIALHLLDLKAMDAPVRVQQTQAVWVAKAVAVVGEKQVAEELTNDILKVNPKLEEATKLKEEIKSKVIDKKYGTARSRINIISKPKATTTTPSAENSRQAPPKVQSPAPVQATTEGSVEKKLQFQLMPKGVEQLRYWDKEN